MEKMVLVEWLPEFIGKWVITEECGTHAPVARVVNPNSASSHEVVCFPTREAADVECAKMTHPDQYEVMRIKRDYPVILIRLVVWGSESR
jgi:hypothetical protein